MDNCPTPLKFGLFQSGGEKNLQNPPPARPKEQKENIFHCGGEAAATKNNLRHVQLDFLEPFGDRYRIAPPPYPPFPLPLRGAERGELRGV
jgi:hypothetical protein